jgi:protein-L-isoaspartate(D-aspartate) O-methyltransferase
VSIRTTQASAAALAAYLRDTGTEPRWADAVAAVSRAGFLPDLMWPYDMDSRASIAVDRGTDPQAWEQAVFADMPLTIQWDDGDHEGADPGRLATSSASMPSVVTAMLQDADLQPGMRVLEIGTGTGWSAGLMAHVLGPGAVVSVEIDPDVAEHAARRLNRTGADVRLVVGDGRDGWATNAPYDRVIATAGIRQVPAAWIAQTAPGGLVVAPWGTHYGNGDALLRLTVAGDGSASGRFVRPLEFMKVRSDRTAWPNLADRLPDGFPAGLESRDTAVTLSELTGEKWGPTEFVIGLAVPDCAHAVLRDGDTASVWFYGLSDASWSVATFDGENAVSVYQGGPRQLWDEVEAALSWWASAGRPGLERFGLTVDASSEVAWVDDPSNPVPH